ncbi:MAG: VOC family protein [Leptolyngbyaceae cyanobacterium]
MTVNAIFHLASTIQDLAQARAFYGGLLDCPEGRSTDTWVDFDFFGHQLSLHLGEPTPTQNIGIVDHCRVPMPHFDILLTLPDWQALAQKITNAHVDFVIAPTMRFVDQPGEQGTMFFRDPFGNPIEIKGFASFANVYRA